MAYQLIYNDLIEVPNGWNGHGIYWLRLYSSNNHIAIVTEVPGNPSLSVGNGIESIANYICTEYQIESSNLVLYQIVPDYIDASNYLNKGSIKKVTFAGNSPNWIDSSRKEIESLVGISLIELPKHDTLYEKVLQLGGGVIEDVWQDVFEPVLVSELPFPHNPSSCEHSKRFEDFHKQIKLNSNLEPDLEFKAGKIFLESITAKDISTCRYHKGNWKAIADESVRIIEALDDPTKYKDEAYKSTISEYDRRWLTSLFADPIFIGGGSYTNGQHRGCALRFSGAERAAVVAGDDLIGQICVDWTYLGNG